jgi:hypothetical protein
MASKIHGLVLALHGCRLFEGTFLTLGSLRKECLHSFSFLPCAVVMSCTGARTYACTQFSNVRVDIHDRGAGEGCQLTLVQDSIPSKCVEAADRYQRLCYRFPLSLVLRFSLPASLSRSLVLSRALSLRTCMSSDWD